MRHQDLTLNHRLETWVYANAAARTGATGFVAGDVGRIAYQTDTGEYYRLTATTPTWALIALPTTATYVGAQQSPTGTTSGTGVMCGFGTATYGTAQITPVRSGKIVVNLTGRFSNTAAAGSQFFLRYGTLPAPANGAALAGTTIGGIVQTSASYAAGAAMPISITALVTGLTLGTAYWIDCVQVSILGGGTAALFTAVMAAYELP
jgi:hypothetical protein